MLSTDLFFLASLLHLSLPTSAAPPPLPLTIAPNPSLIQASLNLTAPLLHILNLTAAHTFPPQSELPRDGIFFNSVPNSALTLKFRDWILYNRPFLESVTVLTAATYDCFGHGADPIMSAESHEWSSGESVLEVTPMGGGGGGGEEERQLTWQKFLHVIEMIRGWVRAYPGLYVGFEIYEEDGEQEWYLGYGVLTIYEDGTSVGSI